MDEKMKELMTAGMDERLLRAMLDPSSFGKNSETGARNEGLNSSQVEKSLEALLNTTAMGRGGRKEDEEFRSLQDLLSPSTSSFATGTTRKKSSIFLPNRKGETRLWPESRDSAMSASVEKTSLDMNAGLYDDLKMPSSSIVEERRVEESNQKTVAERKNRAKCEAADDKMREKKRFRQCSAWSCEKQGTFRCGTCGSRWYCSRSCQRFDWKHVHRLQCKDLKKAKDEASTIRGVRSQVTRVHLRQGLKTRELARQDEALRQLSMEGVDYVLFPETVSPVTSKSSAKEFRIRFPNMGAKLLLRLYRIKAAEGHLVYVKKLHKLLIDHAPRYTLRIQKQLNAEYNADPLGPAVQKCNDENAFIHPTPYETNRAFAQLGIASIEDRLRRSGIEESMAQAKERYRGKTLDGSMAEAQGISLEELHKRIDDYEKQKNDSQQKWAKAWLDYRENGGVFPEGEGQFVETGPADDLIHLTAEIDESLKSIQIEEDEDGHLVSL